MKALPAFVLLAALAAACSQTSPRVGALLDRLRAYANDYRDHLPSLSCDESLISQLIEKGKVKQEVRAEATLREIRDDSAPDSFKDQYEFKTVNGRPAKVPFKMPVFVYAAFPNGIGFFGSSNEGDVCYDYQLTEEDGGATLRLELAAKPENTDPVCKEVFEGYRKTVIVDAATGVIRHIDRSMSAIAALREDEVFSASIDYGPVKFGEKTFWLPVRIESHHWDGQRQMTATFSNCHRYTAELKIVPGEAQPLPSEP